MQRKCCARALACALAVAAPLAPGQPDAIYVTPLDTDEASIVQPASVLRGEELRRRQASSLGDTLGSETGVHSSGMSPGASRPVIRGLDAPRVRVLEDGASSMDVSSISPDHRIAVETLGATQVEILRGPASLIHGGGAIGGVVNVVTKRVPRERLDGFVGAAEIRLGGAAREATGLADLNGGNGSAAWHLDAYRRNAGDYRIPGAQNPNDPSSPVGRVANSFVDAKGVNLGATAFGARGYLGLGLSRQEAFYGIPTAEQARIGLGRTRADLASELHEPFAGFSRARLRLGVASYGHDEIEPAGEVATRFRNRQQEARIELSHLPVGPLSGVLGFSAHGRRFSATGEETFLVPTKSTGVALFVVEQARAGALRAELGGRVERERHRPQAAAGPAARSFHPATWSAGLAWDFAPGHSLALTVTRAERAPAIEELYANGPHRASATFEVGDASLAKEVARNLDLGLRGSSGPWRWKAGVYVNRFRNYVFAQVQDVDGNGVFDPALDRVDKTGAPDPAGEFVRVNYRQTGARFRGVEAEIAYRPARGPGGRLFADTARGTLAGFGNAPRMAPARIGLDLTWSQGALAAHATLLRVFRQDRIAAAQETATPGYTRLDAGLSWRPRQAGQSALTLYLQANNLLDRDMRVHTSFLKDSAPLAGRSLMAGVRATF
jgi:iron complex outermembrane receptor protein